MVVAVLLTALSAAPVRAETDVSKPLPRGSVVIGDTSVVLIAANDKIYALVDRLEDNAPVADATLSVDLANGPGLNLSRISDGLFVAPFNRAGHLEDAFMISLASPDGTGEGAAELQYEDMPAPQTEAVPFDLRGTAAAGLLVGAVGALLAGSAMVLSRTRRRRAAVRLAGSAAARP
jgi:hypothetical protein